MLFRKAKIIVILVILMVLVFVVNAMMGGVLYQYGIVPRSIGAWYHIFTAPFIHGSFGHLVNNLIGLCLFSVICLVRPIRFFVWASLFIISLTGVLVWQFGRDAVHIGASGWVFGLWSLSIAIAWFDRSFQNILLAGIVIFLYGGMIYGILPIAPGVSFESHLFGAVSGVLFAAFARKRGKS